MKRLGRMLGAAVAASLLAALLAGPAQAAFGLHDVEVSFLNKNGTPATQAGSHPYAVKTSFDVNTRIDPELGVVPDGDLKSLRFSLPAGFIGSRTAVPPCAEADFLTVDLDGRPACPDASAIGVALLQIFNAGNNTTAAVYNLIPPPGAAAKIGFFAVGNSPVTVEIGVSQTPPYNVTATVANAPQAAQFFGSSIELWGTPADHSHDPFRGKCLSFTVGPQNEAVSDGICNTGAPEVPFITLPRSCTGTLSSTYEALSWQNPTAVPVTGSAPAPGMSGCSKVGFSPQVGAKPTVSSAETASGLDFTIGFSNAGFTSPTGIAQSEIKKAVVRMPVGMTLNPSAAAGLVACSRAGYEAESLSSQPGQGCPQASKVGEVEAQSPAAEGEILKGSVFVASQDDNPFGSLLALYMVIKDPTLGALVKLAGRIDVSEEQGPGIGRLTTTFDEVPQVPVSEFKFHFNEGPRGALVTPPTCGTYTTEVALTPWANPDNPLQTTAEFKVGSGVGGGPCPAGAPPFHPGFEAGSVNNSAGAYSPFNLRYTRQDGEQAITRLSTTLPPGVTAKIAGVAKCPEAAIATARSRSGRAELAAPSCPAAAKIGRVLGGSGVGFSLTYVPGSLYLAGPFGGDPLSAVAIVPAVTGPFDVGTVVTRLGLTINPVTYLAEVDGSHSEPIPYALKGIPLRVRDLRAYTDRPNFTLNPTSCARYASKATIFGAFLNPFSSADDVSFSPSARYQAASCASLGFKPKLSLSLKGGGTERGGHPALKSVITYPSKGAYSNIGKAVVTLPPSEFIDNAHIQSPCTRVQFNANQCPKGSILGTAVATTPLLEEPLKGTVYFRSNGGERNLPDIVVDLKGLFHITLVGKVDATNARVRTTFEQAPDAPVSKVTVSLKGGKQGLLVNNRNLCAHKLRARVALTAQNGRLAQSEPLVKTSCKKKKR